MPEKLRVGTVEVEPGQKKSVLVTVGNTSTWDVKLPLFLVNGSRSGPKLCITAGMHPTEYAGIEAAFRIPRLLNPEQLSGAVISVPIVNTPAFQSRSRLCPVDGTNLNRLYPGQPDGTVGNLIASFLTKEVFSQSNFYVDNHCADVHEVAVNNMIYYEVEKDDVDKNSREMCKCFDTPYARVVRPKEPVTGQMSSVHYTAQLGCASVLSEVGSCGGLSKSGKIDEDDVSWNVNGIMNVMKHFGMTEGSPRLHEKQKVIPNWVELFAKQAGIFYPRIDIGNRVAKGEVIGETRNLLQEPVETIESPINGIISLYYAFFPAVDPGRRLVQIFEV